MFPMYERLVAPPSAGHTRGATGRGDRGTTDRVTPTTADSLALFRPHAPTGDPFADTWYFYLNDPAVGYLKIVFLSYVGDDTPAGTQCAYVHIAHAPLSGPRVEYDHYFPEVTTGPVHGPLPHGFRFEVPGSVAIDETTLRLTLADVTVEAAFVGPHHHYFDEPHPAASPFFGPVETAPPDALADADSHWFVFTLGTPARYRLQTGAGTLEGTGLMYAERGWSVRQAFGFCYLMAVSDEARLVLTCGMPAPGSQVWAARVVTASHDLTFLPFAGDVTADADLQPSAGRAVVTLTQGDLEVRVISQASSHDFYDQVTPSVTVFHADHPVAKTMNARLDLQIVQNGEVIEQVTLPQSILEFGGVLYPGSGGT